MVKMVTKADLQAERDIMSHVLRTSPLLRGWDKNPDEFVLDASCFYDEACTDLACYGEAKASRMPFGARTAHGGFYVPVRKLKKAQQLWNAEANITFMWVRFPGGAIYEARLLDDVDLSVPAFWFGRDVPRFPGDGEMCVVVRWDRWRAI